MSKKTISSLRERRLVEDAVARLAETSSEAELEQEIQVIAGNHERPLILSAIRRHLDTDNSQLRGGLGRLSALLGGPEIVEMLRREAGRRDNPTGTRLNAAMILERFHQVAVSPGLMGGLEDPGLVVMQSLREAVEAGRTNRRILLEYVKQMREENKDVAFLVLDLIGQLDEEDQPELLRLIAYDTRGDVAETALGRLGALRGQAITGRSAAALYALRSSIRPELAQHADRHLRKLRLSGARWEPEAAERLWALISPCDFQGTQHLWILEDSGADECRLVGLRINRAAGILDCFGGENVDCQQLPQRRRVGEMVSISVGPNESADFVTVPYNFARHCLEGCLESHWKKSTGPLPEEFTLFASFIYGFRSEEISEQLSALLDSGQVLWEAGKERLWQEVRSLLQHPGMANWILPVGAMGAGSGEHGNQEITDEEEAIGRRKLAELPLKELEGLARKVVSEDFPQELSEQFRLGLIAQAEWFHFTGEMEVAQRAVFVAESLRHEAHHRHPLIVQMIALGLSRQ